MLEEAHKGKFAIHLGITTVYQDLKIYWWLGMKKDVASFVTRCLVYQKPLKITKWKWEGISMDFVMGLPKTLLGLNAIWMNGQSEKTIQTLEDMLKACVLDEGGSWNKFLPLIKFVYNNTIKLETIDKIRLIRERMCTTQSKQKNYANMRKSLWNFRKENMEVNEGQKIKSLFHGSLSNPKKSRTCSLPIGSSTIIVKSPRCLPCFTTLKIWLRNLVTSLSVVDGIERPLKIYCDNNLTVLYSNNNRSSTKSKFIDIRFLVIERVQNKQISIKHIGTSFMLVDPLTKGLIPKVFYAHPTHMS
ncbi:hypothetical protein CR513_21391, partial [Mucuna pruriens]